MTGQTDAETRRDGRPIVLHIASDYTDGVREDTTLAVNRLVEGADKFEHIVISLHRSSLPVGLFFRDLGSGACGSVRVFAYRHFGLPLGIGLFGSFWIVARRVERMLRELGLHPAAVHAHRLTFDGIGGWLLAKKLNIPLFVSIRGEVESKVFRFKPTYRPLMRHIVSRAAAVFYVSVWFAERLERWTGVDARKTRLLPNIVLNEPEDIRPDVAGTSFLVIANLDLWKKKGLDGLIGAFALAAPRLGAARLEIVGRGSERSIAAVRQRLERRGIADRVELTGALPNEEVHRRMGRAIAVVLPSRNETFGMVYVEALFAGTPILYSRGTGIDGFLDGMEVGVAVDPDNVSEIAEALVLLRDGNEQLRTAIATNSGELKKRFGRKRILEGYQEALREGLPNADIRNR